MEASVNEETPETMAIGEMPTGENVPHERCPRQPLAAEGLDAETVGEAVYDADSPVRRHVAARLPKSRGSGARGGGAGEPGSGRARPHPGKRPHRRDRRRAHLPGHRQRVGVPGSRREAQRARQHLQPRERRGGPRLHRRPPAHVACARRPVRPRQHRRQHARLLRAETRARHQRHPARAAEGRRLRQRLPRGHAAPGRRR